MNIKSMNISLERPINLIWLHYYINRRPTFFFLNKKGNMHRASVELAAGSAS